MSKKSSLGVAIPLVLLSGPMDELMAQNLDFNASKTSQITRIYMSPTGLLTTGNPSLINMYSVGVKKGRFGINATIGTSSELNGKPIEDSFLPLNVSYEILDDLTINVTYTLLEAFGDSFDMIGASLDIDNGPNSLSFLFDKGGKNIGGFRTGAMYNRGIELSDKINMNIGAYATLFNEFLERNKVAAGINASLIVDIPIEGLSVSADYQSLSKFNTKERVNHKFDHTIGFSLNYNFLKPR